MKYETEVYAENEYELTSALKEHESFGIYWCDYFFYSNYKI